MFPDITSPVFLHYFALNSLLAGFIIYLFSYRLFKFNFFINILLASIASGIIGLAISFLVLGIGHYTGATPELSIKNILGAVSYYVYAGLLEESVKTMFALITFIIGRRYGLTITQAIIGAAVSFAFVENSMYFLYEVNHPERLVSTIIFRTLVSSSMHVLCATVFLWIMRKYNYIMSVKSISYAIIGAVVLHMMNNIYLTYWEYLPPEILSVYCLLVFIIAMWIYGQAIIIHGNEKYELV